jgi:hypothetical protein
MEVNRYRNQWHNHIEDNFGSIMPLPIWRVTWKDENDEYQELWTQSKEKALKKKQEVDHSDGRLKYVNFEGWLAYRFNEHDKRFGWDKRPVEHKERDWWEPRNDRY